jgi:hypothetical protein
VAALSRTCPSRMRKRNTSCGSLNDHGRVCGPHGNGLRNMETNIRDVRLESAFGTKAEVGFRGRATRCAACLGSGTKLEPLCILGTIFSVVCYRVLIDRCTLRTQLLSLVRRKQSQRAVREDKSIELLA